MSALHAYSTSAPSANGNEAARLMAAASALGSPPSLSRPLMARLYSRPLACPLYRAMSRRRFALRPTVEQGLSIEFHRLTSLADCFDDAGCCESSRRADALDMA